MSIYEMPVYRPPSEANSLLVQVAHGCSYNKCIFCYMYKGVQYKAKSFDEIVKHTKNLKTQYKNPTRVFLVGGDVFNIDTNTLLDIINLIKKEFPNIQRISSYCSAINALKKSHEELNSLRNAGVSLLYLGIESGSDIVLDGMCKGVTKHETITGCQNLQAAGFDLSVMVISGLGGRNYLKEHAIETAKVINSISPKYFSLLSLEIKNDNLLKGMKKRFDFIELIPKEIMEETILMLENIEVKNCTFRSNHASNYVRLMGTLSQDREKLINILNEVIKTL